MSQIVPNIDAYGTYARHSALADILEVQALNGESMSEAKLADYIRDNEWTRKTANLFDLPGEVDEETEGVTAGGELSEEVDQSVQAALEVFEMIAERAQVLESDYPFNVQYKRVVYSGPLDHSSTYLALLAITIAHAYRLPTTVNPRDAFEDLVTEALVSRNLLTANLGRAARTAADLGEALDVIASKVNLHPSLEQAVRRRNAQEEGVDLVAHAPFHRMDHRPGRWVFIGQATCAKSDRWRAKMAEPSEERWKQALGMWVLPRPFLAVPHHMPREVMLDLAQQASSRALMLDRLRLTGLNAGVAGDYAQLINDLLAVEVES